MPRRRPIEELLEEERVSVGRSQRLNIPQYYFNLYQKILAQVKTDHTLLHKSGFWRVAASQKLLESRSCLASALNFIFFATEPLKREIYEAAIKRGLGRYRVSINPSAEQYFAAERLRTRV
ncbi:MAG: hypothetical protein A3E87_08455 [Gammaproteobacteria bacterium RIFCSPHIGHO2_12_FULL_35_23]|nr:MAG: hypothetical protein A3E87_08455 [Gammaproteobacteria bacterium RIFCSPHIGHO2_12_FULL_35_23]